MNPLDRVSIPNDEIDSIPLPLFEDQRHQHRSRDPSEYRQVLASVRARISNLEDKFYPQSATDHETPYDSTSDSESSWDAAGPQSLRRGVLLADTCREMNEEEFRAHHYLLDNYRITYHRHASTTTTSSPSPRTIPTDGPDRHNASSDANQSHPPVTRAPGPPRRSIVLEPLSIDDFVQEYLSGEIDTFYGSIFGIMVGGD
ncbi:hypothetical protein MMC11_007471 [Xylographa trunciseda]|nr:hypothetical protein [Xylographa trunciseda]